MPRPASENTFQITFKVPEQWIAQADEVAAAMSRPGLTLTRTDALRTALARGLETLEAETKVRSTYLRVLEFVHSRKTVLPGDVAGEFGTSIELANGALHRLKRAGLVQAVPPKGDRLPRPGEQSFRFLPSSFAEGLKILRGSGIDPDALI